MGQRRNPNVDARRGGHSAAAALAPAPHRHTHTPPPSPAPHTLDRRQAPALQPPRGFGRSPAGRLRRPPSAAAAASHAGKQKGGRPGGPCPGRAGSRRQGREARARPRQARQVEDGDGGGGGGGSGSGTPSPATRGARGRTSGRAGALRACDPRRRAPTPFDRAAHVRSRAARTPRSGTLQEPRRAARQGVPFALDPSRRRPSVPRAPRRACRRAPSAGKAVC